MLPRRDPGGLLFFDGTIVYTPTPIIETRCLLNQVVPRRPQIRGDPPVDVMILSA